MRGDMPAADGGREIWREIWSERVTCEAGGLRGEGGERGGRDEGRET